MSRRALWAESDVAHEPVYRLPFYVNAALFLLLIGDPHVVYLEKVQGATRIGAT